MTKKEIITAIYRNPSSINAHLRMINAVKKETFDEAMRIYNEVSHKAAIRFLNDHKNWSRY